MGIRLLAPVFPGRFGHRQSRLARSAWHQLSSAAQAQPGVPKISALFRLHKAESILLSWLELIHIFYPRNQSSRLQELESRARWARRSSTAAGATAGACGGRWQVEAPASVVAWICNCSNCSMRGNTHFVVPAAKFSLQDGADEFLTTYTFGTNTAKHKFCRICGITSFYIPRSNPDGVAVTVACVDPGTLSHIEYNKADGRNWEKWFERSDISEFSKAAAAE